MKVRKDLSGKVFTRLTVLNNYEFRPQGNNPKRNRTFWECQCECGNTGFYRSETLLRGETKSCGCLVRSGLRGNFRHGKRHSRIYYIWSSVIARCENANSNSFESYGGRGITLCRAWREDFMAFDRWANSNGYTEDLTLDRIDNSGNYEPSNCRWVTLLVQANNKRNNRIIEIDGVSKTLADWSKMVTLSYKHFHMMLKRGKDIKAILSEYKIT